MIALNFISKYFLFMSLYCIQFEGFWIVMLNGVKHLGLEQDLFLVVGVRFFAALRMTSSILLFLKNFHNLLSRYLFVQSSAGGVGRSAAFAAYGFVKFLKQIVSI